MRKRLLAASKLSLVLLACVALAGHFGRGLAMFLVLTAFAGLRALFVGSESDHA